MYSEVSVKTCPSVTCLFKFHHPLENLTATACSKIIMMDLDCHQGPEVSGMTAIHSYALATGSQNEPNNLRITSPNRH